MNARFQVYQFDSATWVVTDTAVNAQVCECCDLDGHPLSARERAQMIAGMLNRAAAAAASPGGNRPQDWLQEVCILPRSVVEAAREKLDIADSIVDPYEDGTPFSQDVADCLDKWL